MEHEEAVYQISWTKRATQQLLDVAVFISESSEQQSKKVVLAIHKTIGKAARNPLHFPPDKFRLVNNGSYRAFQKYKYRVTYRVLKEEIRIVSIRHTSRRPCFY